MPVNTVPPQRQDDPDELWKIIESKDKQLNDLRHQLVKYEHFIEVCREITGVEVSNGTTK
jgi:hypothetical protein